MDLKALDKRHLIHPFTQVPVESAGGPIIIREAEGCVVKDIDGKEYLDAIGALWLAEIGYSRPELAEAAAAQMRRLSFWSTFWGFSNDAAVRLAARLAQLAPGNLNRVLFTSGGSEANETSIKMARAYHRHRGEPDRTVIIALKQAYHGVSNVAMTATGLESVRTGFGPLAEDFVHISPPYTYRCSHGEGCSDCGESAARELERAIAEIGPRRVAAFVAEPVQGVGGVIVPPPSYFPRVREICDHHGILWIADEVITGFGRTGRWFGVEHWGVVPDIMTIAKGVTSGYLPLGASILGDHVYQAFEDARAMVNHGFTYSGHPVACAVAMENLRIIEEEDLPARAERVGHSLREALENLDNPYIGEVRGLGLMAGVEVVADRVTRALPEPNDVAYQAQALCRDRGVIVRGLSPGNIISMSPPLIINQDQVDRLVRTLDEVIRQVMEGREARVG